ncbi:hypothetical protein Q3G72_012556 [Acer saccharum]|nr:hypothetical protein Q3G72_012556 [Acer saccharum]
MIYATITTLKKKNRSSKIAIGKHIEQSYSNLPANHSTLLTQHLQRLKNTEHLLMVKKSYKLPRCDAPVPETNNNNNQDNAVNISSSAHGSKTSRGPGRPPKNLNAVKAQPVSVSIGLVDQTPHLMPAKRGRGRQISGPPVGLGGRADAVVPKLKHRTKRHVGRPKKVQVQAQSISDAVGEADAVVPKSQVQAQAQAQPILTVPKSKSRTRRPVGRPRKVQVQAQPISNAVSKADKAVPKSQVQVQTQPISDTVGKADAAVPKSQVQAQAQPILTVPKSKRRTRRVVGRPKKVQVQAQPILDAVGKVDAAVPKSQADAAVPKSQVQAQAQPILTVPKSKRRTRRPVGRPRKVQVHAQPISDAAVLKSQVQAQAQPILTVPKSKRRTRRPVRRPRKVQVQAQPISDAVGEADASVPKSQVQAQAQAQPILTVPKSKCMTRRPVGRPRKDEVVSQRESSENDVRCLRGELQQVRDDRDRQELRVQALTIELDLKERQLTAATAANEKSTALTAKLDLKDRQLTAANEKLKVCIFAYGQTGSGKSFTMIGRPECAEKKGIISRSLEQIFQISQSLSTLGWKHKLQASIFEVYKNKIKDLTVENQSTDLTILHDANRDAYVSGLKIVDVGNIEEISSLLQQATQARFVGTTQMNEQSSRSHLVFIMRISRVNEGTGQQVDGVLNLIDLAGSDCLAKSGAINLSLSHLRKVITALVKKQDHVPYRDSNLTHILQPYLGKGAKTLMVVNIAPNPSSVGESVSSLRFASTAFGSTVTTVQPTSLQHGDSSKLKSP